MGQLNWFPTYVDYSQGDNTLSAASQKWSERRINLT
jgi:hypothetical protein